MKKGISITLALCILLSLFSPAISAQDTEIFFEPAYEMTGERLEPNFDKTSISLMSASEPLPSSFDARDLGWVTPVKNQLGTPLCGAFSVISALESSSIAQGFADNTVDYSEAHLGWFAHCKSTDPDDPTYGDGCTMAAHEESATTPGVNFKISLHALTRWSGIALDSDYPLSKYYDDDFSDDDRYNTGSGVVIKNAEKLTSTDDIKRWIMENGSVVVSYASNAGFYENGTYYNNSEYITEPSHAVAIIGWDDSYPASNFFSGNGLPPTNGAWLCKNSWGDSFSFFWMSYCEPTMCAFAGYVVQPADKYRENYTYNGSEYAEVAKMPFAASAANVFKTDEHELLSAISVRTVNPNQPLNISIYTNLDSDYSTPVDGTLALEMSTTIKNEGYHAIELPKNILLDANSHFSVVVEFLTVDGYAVIPVERNSAYAASKDLTYASKPGQSYIYLETKASWRTNTQFGIENVLIQAFTNCDHQLETIVTEPTCENDGDSQTKCKQCSEIIESTVIPKVEHSYKWSVETAPTATESGSKKQICTGCGEASGETETISATGFEPTNGMTVDYADNVAYGLAAGVDSLENYTQVVADSCEWSYESGQYGFGTGSKAILKKGDETVGEYTILIFGDVNGDGWYDADDAFLVNLMANGLLTEDKLPDYMWKAADCNHDGLINEFDVELLMGAGVRRNDIDQNADQSELATQTAYIAYASLIDQSAGMYPDVAPEPDTDDADQGATEADSNEIVESDKPAVEMSIEAIIINTLELIKKIFAFIFCFIIQ